MSFVRVMVATAAVPAAGGKERRFGGAVPGGVAVISWGSGGLAERRVRRSATRWVRAALQMAVLFQAVLFLVAGVRAVWGDPPVVSGAARPRQRRRADDPMAKTAAVHGRGDPAVAIAVGILSNTLFKLALAAGLGRGSFRIVAGAGLAAMAAASAIALSWGRL